MKRRQFLLAAAASSATSGLLPLGAAAGPLSGKADDPQAEWFDAVTGGKSVTGTLNLHRFREPIYALTKPIAWSPSPGSNLKFKSVEVPAGFVTDFASVPRVFWAVLPRDGTYVYPAIIHDFLYWEQSRPREEADDILNAGMEEFNVSTIARNAIYYAVRAAGGFAWDENRALQQAGERRVIYAYPSSPLVSWHDWKRRLDVFSPPLRP